MFHQAVKIRDEDPTFFSTDPDPAGKKMRIWIRLKKNADPDPTLNRNEEKKYIQRICFLFPPSLSYFIQGRGSDIFSTEPDRAQLEKNPDPDSTPDPTLNRNEEKIISIFYVGRHKIQSFKLSFSV